MRTYFAGIISKIKQHSEKLDNLTLLTNNHWVVLDELANSKYVYIFRSNNDLLISQNGKVEKGKWEYLGNNSLLIEQRNEFYLFRHGFFDNNILALKVDGKDEFAFLVNENQYGGDLNSIDKVLSFLDTKYLKMIPKNQPESHSIKTKPITLTDKRETYTNSYATMSITNGKEVIHENTEVKRKRGIRAVKHHKYNLYGFENSKGELIIQHQYNGASNFREKLALVYVTKKDRDYYGFIDIEDKEVIPLKYEYAESFSEGLALARQDRMFGYINKNGEVVIDFYFDDAASFKNGKARVRDRKREFYINKNGAEI